MLFLALTGVDGEAVEVVFETICGMVRPTGERAGTRVYTPGGVFEVRETPDEIKARVTETTRNLRARAMLGSMGVRPADAGHA